MQLFKQLLNACYRHIIKLIHIINEPFIVVAPLYFHLDIRFKYLPL